ncbi:hypothetical protein [Conyzicola sp.]|uniref:hypothetical protein n=1 Tax=Conyzicola sp. TaxID=1969404 RepID=UPI0039894FAE
MFSIITQTLRLAAARWPVLLAWYLAGWLGRYLVIELAATLGSTNALLGLLLMPLAILARLASFIGMFLVLRDSMPAFSELKESGLDDVDRTAQGGGRATRIYDIFLVSILPFFAFYAAWQFLGQDTLAYTVSALEKMNVFDPDYTPGGAVIDLRLNWASITAIVLAFAGRYLIKRYRSKLPKWTPIVAVYLEAVWVYLSVLLVSNYIGDVNSWVSSRAAVEWVASVRADITGVFAPVGWIWNGIEWAIAETGALVLLPLSWLALAGIVYGRALAAQPVGFRPRGRYVDSARTRFATLPTAVTRRFTDVGNDFAGRWRPLGNALVLIWRAGVLPMGVFVLAYTLLEAATSWGFLAGVQLIGAHDVNEWWRSFDRILGFGIDAIIEPLRICLIAAGYDFCLRKLEERRDAAAVPGAATAGS